MSVKEHRKGSVERKSYWGVALSWDRKWNVD